MTALTILVDVDNVLEDLNTAWAKIYQTINQIAKERENNV